MIFLALGSNLHGPWGSPADALDRAVEALAAEGVAVVARSRWYRSAPYGGVAAGDFVNGVVAVATHRPPEALMRLCHRVERAAGRARRARWGSRTLDLDLIAYHDVVINPGGRVARQRPGPAHRTPSRHGVAGLRPGAAQGDRARMASPGHRPDGGRHVAATEARCGGADSRTRVRPLAFTGANA
jgi:2-amino-4-hydroxy-6-hydroxymethyldihydropteridine diphosphokinase